MYSRLNLSNIYLECIVPIICETLPYKCDSVSGNQGNFPH